MPVKPLNKIMVVEDEKDIRVILGFTLEKIGKFTVGWCASGTEALEKAEPFAPDLIMLDVMMPGLDGIQTLNALRQKPALKKTPVIFMTAKTQTVDMENYKKMGVIDVISKPFDPAALIGQLNRIWENKAGAE